jgi:hypothetical protein
MTKNHKPVTNFTALMKRQTHKKFVFMLKATYQWAFNGLVIKYVLFHCASSLAIDLQMQQLLQQN